MIKINQIAEALEENDLPDFYDECKRANRLRKWITKVEEMNTGERRFFESRIRHHKQRYNQPNVWAHLIIKILRYKQTVLVGRENFQNMTPPQIYVTAAFCDFGK